MRKTLGTTLLTAGAVIAAAGAIGLAVGVRVKIPPALLAVAEYKAPFIVGAVLMLVGAVLRGRGLRLASDGASVSGARVADASVPLWPSDPPDAITPPTSEQLARERR